MKKDKSFIRIAISILFIFILFNCAPAHSASQDSLRVLITKYDNPKSGLDGVVTFSALMEKDSAQAPIYIIGDSTVQFFSELRVDAINKLTYLYGNNIPKKMRAKSPNGFVIVELKKDVTLQMCQVLPSLQNTQRQAFVTRLPISAFDNTKGAFSSLADELVSSYGTDDQAFRAQQEGSVNETPILALDSLNNKAFVESFNDFVPGTIETIDAYDSINAMKIIGDRGVKGLFVVLIKSSYTLRQALLSPPEKIIRQIQALDRVNHTSLVIRNPIIIK